MEEEKTGFLQWVKANRKQLIIAGVSIAVVIGFVVGVKNKETILELWSSLEMKITGGTKKVTGNKSIQQIDIDSFNTVVKPRGYIASALPFDVSQHIRTLSGGRQHSTEKAIEASELGIMLMPNQTIVNSYTKGGVAA